MTQQEFFTRYSYNIRIDKLGGGSFGSVYKAYDTILDKEVAIKVAEVKIIGDKEFSLREEFKALEGLAPHPNIANYGEVHSFETPHGIFDYAIMQYYPLGNLDSYLKNNEPDFESREKLVLQILDGIDHLHGSNIVHRDLKPSNIMVVDRRGTIIPKITDFGLSKQAKNDGNASRFTNSFAGGTLQYSSPEQLKGQSLKLNTDIWSFGTIVYEILSGEVLFRATKNNTASAEWQNEVTQKILKEDIDPFLKNVPDNWANVIQRCLQRQPSERISSKAEILELLGKASTLEETSVNQNSTSDAAMTQVKGAVKEKDIRASEARRRLREAKTFSNKKEEFNKTQLAVIGLALASLIGFWLFYSNSQDGEENNQIFIFEKDGLYGYLKNSDTLVRPKFINASEFIDGKATVATADSTYIINNKGEWVSSVNTNENTVNGTEESTEDDISNVEVNLSDNQQLRNALSYYKNKNYPKAFEIYNELANKGNPKAQRGLAVLYLGGLGVKKDGKKAFYWYQKSAAQNDIEAQYMVANLYQQGSVVKKNQTEAMYWYKKACSNGNNEACVTLKELDAQPLPPPPPAPEIIEVVEDEDDEIEEDVTVPFAVIEDVPVFPGCEFASNKKVCFQEQMQNHIRKNFRYPEIAQEMGVQGRVAVMFTIQKDGSIGNIRMRGPDKNLEAEALRIIKLLPKMKPGYQRGKPVKVPFSIPITFKLQ